MISPTYCKCGQPWEEPCRCPERVLERFSVTLQDSNRIFYFETFHAWMIKEFDVCCPQLENTVLNLDGVIELGTDMYQTPYEN